MSDYRTKVHTGFFFNFFIDFCVSSKHYLCELCDCGTREFVAFGSELEYKAHCAASHTDHLSREEQRAAR